MPNDTSQIEGLPAGATVTPITSQAPTQIEGLPAGATVTPMSSEADVAARHARSTEGKNINPGAERTGVTGAVEDVAEDVGTGLAKGGAQTITGASKLVNKALPSGVQIPTTDENLKPEGIAQHVGYGVEGLAEWMAGGEGLKAVEEFAGVTKALKSADGIAAYLKNSPKAAKLITYLGNILKGGTEGAMVGGAQGGVKGAATGQGAEGAVTGAKWGAGFGAAAEAAAGVPNPWRKGGALQLSSAGPEPEAVTASGPHASASILNTVVPVDDAVVSKMGFKNASPEARATFKAHVGDKVPVGSSIENHVLRAVKPVSDTIETQSKALDKILLDAPALQESAMGQIDENLHNLRQTLPGGTEEQFGRAIDKERSWYANGELDSTDPKVINNTIRDLDKRINSYNAPEEPIETAANAADAARVILRRTLRDKLNTEIPETKIPNTILSRNLEVRNLLRKKLGTAAADNPDMAQAMYDSELQLGRDKLRVDKENAERTAAWAEQAARVRKNRIVAGAVGAHVVRKTAEAAGVPGAKYIPDPARLLGIE